MWICAREAFSLGWGPLLANQKFKCSNILSNDLLIFNGTDKAHFPLTSRVDKEIYLINLFNQSKRSDRAG